MKRKCFRQMGHFGLTRTLVLRAGLRFNYSGVTPNIYHFVIYGNAFIATPGPLARAFWLSRAGSGRYSLVLTDDVNGDVQTTPDPSSTRSETKRLQRVEVKLDARLILLHKLTTADDFVYTLSDKSERWCSVMERAESVAVQIVDSVGTVRQEFELGQPLVELSRKRKLPSGTVRKCPGEIHPSEKVGATISRQ
jgi:hypothetical protein